MSMKDIDWMGDSLEILREFPEGVKTPIGHALKEVQEGKTPLSAKPLKGLGGVFEIINDFDTNTYRAVYVAKLKTAVYVLHCFQKKSKTGKKTPNKDKNLIKERLKAARSKDKRILEEGYE